MDIRIDEAELIRRLAQIPDAGNSLLNTARIILAGKAVTDGLEVTERMVRALQRKLHRMQKAGERLLLINRVTPKLREEIEARIDSGTGNQEIVAAGVQCYTSAAVLEALEERTREDPRIVKERAIDSLVKRRDELMKERKVGNYVLAEIIFYEMDNELEIAGIKTVEALGAKFRRLEIEGRIKKNPYSRKPPTSDTEERKRRYCELVEGGHTGDVILFQLATEEIDAKWKGDKHSPEYHEKVAKQILVIWIWACHNKEKNKVPEVPEVADIAPNELENLKIRLGTTATNWWKKTNAYSTITRLSIEMASERLDASLTLVLYVNARILRYKLLADLIEKSKERANDNGATIVNLRDVDSVVADHNSIVRGLRLIRREGNRKHARDRRSILRTKKRPPFARKCA